MKMKTWGKLHYAAPDFAQYYQPQHLSLPDQNRHQHANWQVSRALKACAPSENGVLSHCQQHAVWFVPERDDGAATPFRQPEIGVDLEKCVVHNHQAWHELILSPDEQLWLQQHGQTPTHYCAIWTLKEALIKASNGEWADLSRTGVCRRDGRWQLHTHGQTVWQGAVYLLGDFAVSLVWRRGSLDGVIWQGWGNWAAVQPELFCWWD